jgi:hypothetical protein
VFIERSKDAGTNFDGPLRYTFLDACSVGSVVAGSDQLLKASDCVARQQFLLSEFA